MGMFLMKPSHGGFHFVLRAGNGKAIASSDQYANKDACKKGITSVQNSAPQAALEDQTFSDTPAFRNPKFEVFKDKTGHFRFRLKSQTGEIVLSSDAYASKQNCMNGIESVRLNAVNSRVVEEEDLSKVK